MSGFHVGDQFANEQGDTRWPVLAPNGEDIGVECSSREGALVCAAGMNDDPFLVARYTEKAA